MSTPKKNTTPTKKVETPKEEAEIKVELSKLPPRFAQCLLFFIKCIKENKPIPNFKVNTVERAILSQVGCIIKTDERQEIERLVEVSRKNELESRQTIANLHEWIDKMKSRMKELTNENYELKGKLNNLRYNAVMWFGFGIILGSIIACVAKSI